MSKSEASDVSDTAPSDTWVTILMQILIMDQDNPLNGLDILQSDGSKSNFVWALY